MYCLKCTKTLKQFRREEKQQLDCTNCSQKILERYYYSCIEPGKEEKSELKNDLSVFYDTNEDQDNKGKI